eukprot:m51a1_g10845 hypothetical protein (307) ;mRNA; r:33895-34815
MAAMARLLRSLELAQDSGWTVNGVPVAEIERRARPLPSRLDDAATWRCRSASGFLGPDESLRHVIAADWRTVADALGTTHTAIGEALAWAIDAAKRDRAERGVGPCAESRVTLPKNLQIFGARRNLLPDWGSRPAAPAVVVRSSFFAGSQRSPFWNDSLAAGEGLNDEWAEEHTLSNEQLGGASVVVAGSSTAGVARWIADLGFYEGGGHTNPYRVDPELLVAVLTSRATPGASRCVRGRAAAAAQAALAEARQTADDAQEAGECAWAHEFMMRAQKIADELVADAERVAQALDMRCPKQLPADPV